MPNRRTSLATIIAKIGTTYGTDAVPTGAANAMLASDISFGPFEATMVERNNMRAFLGGNQKLVGTKFKKLDYSIELVGSGTVAVAPAWGPLLRACGFSETLTATVRVDYVPVNSAFEWVDQYYEADGVFHKLLGCRGTASLDFSSGNIPKLKLQFKGIDGGIVAGGIAGVDYTAWQTPQVATNTNTQVLKRGATHATGTAPALVGGTSLPYSKFMLDMGIDAPFIPLIGQETVEIMKRGITGDVEIDQSAAEEVAMQADLNASTLSSLGLIHGTVANRRVMVFAPGAQFENYNYSDLNGKLMQGYKLGFPATGTGAAGNELRIVTSF